MCMRRPAKVCIEDDLHKFIYLRHVVLVADGRRGFTAVQVTHIQDPLLNVLDIEYIQSISQIYNSMYPLLSLLHTEWYMMDICKQSIKEIIEKSFEIIYFSLI